jgi:DNA-directed RNA polymerase specialized sigma24 family protein
MSRSRTWRRCLTVQSNAIASLQLRDLEAAIAKLPQEQRQVILLVGLEGMRYEEVARSSTCRSARCARACRAAATSCAG